MNLIHKRCGQLTWGGYPSQSLHEAREKEVKKLQQFDEEVPLAEAEAQEIIISRFVGKWERKFRNEIFAWLREVMS